MTFLQPWLLLALPLVALPVIIHLINQQRFQSVEWAAMMFLLSAKALARGTSKLRHWLIMLLRILAVAAAILAVSRPLSHGWLAIVGGDRASSAIVLLDRSPSMSQAARAGGESKLATVRRQLATTLETLGTSRLVLIDSVSGTPLELSSPRALDQVTEAEPAAAAADLPRLLQAACDQITASQSAASTIWICSDQRANDWNVSDGAWSAIRETLAKMPQPVRLTLLGYPEPAADNLAVRVLAATLEPRGQAWDLLLDIVIQRQAVGGPSRVPVQIELGPARSTVEVDLTGTETLLARHAIPIDAAALAAAGGGGTDRDLKLANGWGRVSIPADTNPADNEFYFSFGMPSVRRTLVVAEDSHTGDKTGDKTGEESRRTLELIAGIPPDKLLRAAVEVVTAEAFATQALAALKLAPLKLSPLKLDDVSLVLWQAALPKGDAADAVSQFVARGGQVMFLPPEVPTPTAFNGLSWQPWNEHSPPLQPASWRADEGLLAATLTGAALPVGDLTLRRTCGIAGEGTPLAALPDGRPLLVRAATDRGGVYFLATTPALRDSDLASNGVVLYAIVQRAIDDGLESVGTAQQADAGDNALGGKPSGVDRRRQQPVASPAPDLVASPASQPAQQAWRQIAGPPCASTEAGFHAGVYESRGRLLALNRPAVEDATEVITDRQLETLFQGLSFSRFEQKAGGLGSIVEEVWRLFLIALLLALVAEGLLCLPRRLPSRLLTRLPRSVPGQSAREAVA